ncbi:unnamed protein product [Protopolystoma xenopodis]|uniref:Uncharacterized protein n=1 Tax=Protopolystoma xenopodis TaxID=117903 RepID=A0A3S5A8B1_9PLAT|nr:unnamed protein product [Protopolystoma xenopodis]
MLLMVLMGTTILLLVVVMVVIETVILLLLAVALAVYSCSVDDPCAAFAEAALVPRLELAVVPRAGLGWSPLQVTARLATLAPGPGSPNPLARCLLVTSRQAFFCRITPSPPPSEGADVATSRPDTAW